MSKFEDFTKANFTEVSTSPRLARLREMRLKDVLDLVNREMARVAGEAMSGGTLARA